MAFFRTGGGTDTSDANATAADILLNKTAYVDDNKITGSMPNNGDVSHTIGAGEVYNVPAGYTSGGVITAIAAGATITVTYTSDFYNKTMTCTKGQTTYTQTTTSSGSTTFSVAEGGTWTITCNGVSRQVDVVLEYTTQMAITKTVTVYSAASDTVSFTDVTGAKTVTTNASGQGSVSISFIPNNTITFTSSIAKNPSNLSQAYSKTITMTDSITTIKVMPDGAIYWYGYGYDDADAKTAGYENAHSSMGYVLENCTRNTNSMVQRWHDTYYFAMFGSKNKSKASTGTINVIAKGTGNPYSGNYWHFFNGKNKSTAPSSAGGDDNRIDITSTQIAKYSCNYLGTSEYGYVFSNGDMSGMSCETYAVWIE